jgi:hypothetical protein
VRQVSPAKTTKPDANAGSAHPVPLEPARRRLNGTKVKKSQCRWHVTGCAAGGQTKKMAFFRQTLASKTSSFLVTEVASMTMALAAELPNGEAPKQLAVLLVAKHLVERLQEGIIESAEPRDSKGKKPKIKAGTRTLFQLKITLKGTEQQIWRRIQVVDCTLDRLHEHIQTAMGWTNSHLHQFEIDGKRYGEQRNTD